MYSFFGVRKYDAVQNSLNVRILYQSEFNNCNHKITGGMSFISDNLRETVGDTTINRNENVTGLYSEYTYSGDKITAIAGLRGDYHNTYDFMLVPRLHLKY